MISTEKIQLNTKAFDECVDFLRQSSTFHDPRINQDFTTLWRLIGNKKLVFACLGDLPEVHCLAHRNPFAVLIVLPKNFDELYQADRVYQLGAIVFAGYQAMRIVENAAIAIESGVSPQLKKEAEREEGRFLNLYRQRFPDWQPNVYQIKLMHFAE